MTESQLKSFGPFKSLPVFDEADAQAVGVATAAGSGFARVCECLTLADVERCLADPALVPLGALRGGVDGGQVVAAYFGARD